MEKMLASLHYQSICLSFVNAMHPVVSCLNSNGLVKNKTMISPHYLLNHF